MMGVYLTTALWAVAIFTVTGLVIAAQKWEWPHTAYASMYNFIFKKPYLYTLDTDYVCPYPVDADDCECDWVKVEECVMTVKAGYTWNGCSPKRNILDLKITGTPEGVIDFRTGKPKTYYASLCHDARYQYRIGSKKNADNCFLLMMEEANFALAKAYYWAVHKFGQKAWDAE